MVFETSSFDGLRIGRSDAGTSHGCHKPREKDIIFCTRKKKYKTYKLRSIHISM